MGLSESCVNLLFRVFRVLFLARTQIVDELGDRYQPVERQQIAAT